MTPTLTLIFKKKFYLLTIIVDNLCSKHIVKIKKHRDAQSVFRLYKKYTEIPVRAIKKEWNIKRVQQEFGLRK